MERRMKRITETYDLIVCGGGLAGVCAAVAAARQGAEVCLVQDRPVLGGNSSSEIRVIPQGAANYHAYARETGIISELLIEERAINHENIWTNSVWDMLLYDLAVCTPRLTLHMNTSIVAVEKTDKRMLSAVVGKVSNAELELTLRARMFLDCTGDGVLAELADCAWRMGSEGREEFGEPHAPPEPSGDVMGSSIYFRAVDTGRPAPYTPPSWAHRYDDASFFYERGRIPGPSHGYWWLELGVPWHTIHDNETIRHELTRHLLGIWDWVKNKDPNLKEAASRYALDWVGQVPGKRESRRIMGDLLLTEHDLAGENAYPDEVAFGGWFIDLHSPGGLLADISEPTAVADAQQQEHIARSYVGPYGLPLRAMIVRDADNLMMAGRNVSATHVALGSVRVMGTTALMGQAAGTAAAIALRHGLTIRETTAERIGEVQQTLLREGCFLPHALNEDPLDLARTARIWASSEAVLNEMPPAEIGRSAPDAPEDRLLRMRSQWLAVDGGRLDAISVFVSNDSGCEQRVAARLVPVAHIWDYRAEPSPPLAQTMLSVPPGRGQWIEWPMHMPAERLRAGYVRLELDANPALCWHRACEPEPGHVAAERMDNGRLRRYGTGVGMALKVKPGQRCYPAGHVISGVTRPYRSTNMWRSDPEQQLPQRLELTWPQPVAIAAVELTFPGHLLHDFRFYGAGYRAPECPKRYAIWARTDGEWQRLLEIADNYQRQRKHRLPVVVETDALRIVVEATNGASSAEICEVRCYAPD